MGKAKFVILAAIVLLVQTSSSAGFVKDKDIVQVKNVVAADDCDWPMFGRSPDGNRVVPDGCGVSNLDFGEKWSKQVSTKTAYDPIIADGKMFVSFQDKTLYCVDLNNGQTLWKFANSCIDPLFFKGQVFFGSGDSFYCLDATDGKIKWQTKLTKLPYSRDLVIYQNKLYFSGEGIFYCVDAINGEKLWSVDRFSQAYNFKGNAIVDGRVYFLYSPYELRCLDCMTGVVIWKYKTKNEPYTLIDSTVVVADGKVFCSTYGDGFSCFEAETGKLLWKNKYCNEGAVYYKNQLFVAWGLFLVVMDPDNGNVLWKSDQLRIDREPIAVGDYIFCNGVRNEDNIFIFDIASHKMIKNIKYPELETFLISKNCLYLVSNNGIVCCYEADFKTPSRIELTNRGPRNIDLCRTLNLAAKVLDQNNKEIKDAKVEWSVEPNDIGAIDNTGTFKPTKTGVATITCKCGDAVATVDINVVEYLSTSVKNLVLTNVKPYQVYKTTLTYTNNSDSKLNVKLTPSTDLITLEPSEFSIDPGKDLDVLVSCNLKEFVPSAVTNFTIDADYGGCPKSTPGTIINADKYSCLTVTPDRLDFELVKRGNSKTLSLTFESNAKQNLTITCDNPWVEISKKTLAMDVGQKESVDFKIMASSLPPSTKLSANIKVSSDKDFCESFSIPLTVMTEDSITIKLQVNSKEATINGQERTLDVPAQIVAGRTMVPLRFISESFGCSIAWDAASQKISIIRYDITVNLWIGKDYVEVNGNRLKIDSPPVIIGGRTMVPLRFIAEPFGADVRWDAQTKGITIIWPKP